MNNSFKNLFEGGHQGKEDDLIQKNREVKINVDLLSNQARKKCREASGNPQILEVCMEENFEKFKQECKDNAQRQIELKKPYLEQQENLKSKLKSEITNKSLKQEEIADVTREIALIEAEILEAINKPEKFGIEFKRISKVNFYIGLVLLIPVSLYLIMFYVSASYSAFYRNFESDTQIVQSIFDGQAISKALNDPSNGSWQNLMIICCIPFVFMALGYLIYMLQQSEGKVILKILKIFLLVSATFIFDFLMAYYIDHKLFDLEKLPGEIYDLSIAIESVSFWIIIFAGFVVYMVWGFVLGFVINEYKNLDLIGVFLRTKKKERKNKMNKRIELKKELQNIKLGLTKLEGETDIVNAKINGFVFESKAYLLYHTEFLSHWCLEIGNVAMSQEEKQKLLQNCHDVGKRHLTNHKLTQTDTEHIVYS